MPTDNTVCLAIRGGARPNTHFQTRRRPASQRSTGVMNALDCIASSQSRRGLLPVDFLAWAPSLALIQAPLLGHIDKDTIRHFPMQASPRTRRPRPQYTQGTTSMAGSWAQWRRLSGTWCGGGTGWVQTLDVSEAAGRPDRSHLGPQPQPTPWPLTVCPTPTRTTVATAAAAVALALLAGPVAIATEPTAKGDKVASLGLGSLGRPHLLDGAAAEAARRWVLGEKSYVGMLAGQDGTYMRRLMECLMTLIDERDGGLVVVSSGSNGNHNHHQYSLTPDRKSRRSSATRACRASRGTSRSRGART